MPPGGRDIGVVADSFMVARRVKSILSILSCARIRRNVARARDEAGDASHYAIGSCWARPL